MSLKKGLVLGSGGARGFAHLGILQVLEEENIEMDVVVGCSAGAIFGAFWCAGLDLHRIGRLFTYPGFAKKLLDPAEEAIRLGRTIALAKSSEIRRIMT